MKKIAMLFFCFAAIVMLWQFAETNNIAEAEQTVSAIKAQPEATLANNNESKKLASVKKSAVSADAQFEQAVEIIKKYEGLHQPKHWPLVGYGHLILPGEKYNRSKALSQTQAEALLRKDLLKNCAAFREFGQDSLLLGVLAYNIGSGNVKRSAVVKKLRQGDRNIKQNFLAHSRYKGKVNPQLQRRRIEEFETLFITSPDSSIQLASVSEIGIIR